MKHIEVSDQDDQSEVVRDFIYQIPNWLVRWGITVIFLAVLAGFFVSWLIHYPTIVIAPFRLTAQNAPKPVIIKTDGRLIKLFVNDEQPVVAGQLIAYLESTANHNQVLQLLIRLQTLRQIINADRFDRLSIFPAHQFQELGELQPAYENFMQSYIETLSLFSNGYYTRRKVFLKKELNDLIKTQQQLFQQNNVYIEDLKLAQREFAIQKKLYKAGDISLLDFQREESKYIAKHLPIKQTEITITSNSTAQTQKRREITELERQSIEQKNQFKQSINTLISELIDWKKRYLLEAPLSGYVHFSMVVQENQPVQSGLEVMYIGSKKQIIILAN